MVPESRFAERHFSSIDRCWARRASLMARLKSSCPARAFAPPLFSKTAAASSSDSGSPSWVTFSGSPGSAEASAAVQDSTAQAIARQVSRLNPMPAMIASAG
jgi:hypothetical protein